MSRINVAGLLAAIAGAIDNAARTGHVTVGDVANLAVEAVAAAATDSGVQDRTVVSFHPYVDHPEHPDPERRRVAE